MHTKIFDALQKAGRGMTPHELFLAVLSKSMLAVRSFVVAACEDMEKENIVDIQRVNGKVTLVSLKEWKDA